MVQKWGLQDTQVFETEFKLAKKVDTQETFTLEDLIKIHQTLTY